MFRCFGFGFGRKPRRCCCFVPRDKETVTFSRVSHGASFEADQQLLDQLNESPHFQLEEADLNDCQIIFVFCIINTRIESDVKAAMEQIPEPAGDKPVILVVMHHIRDIDFTTTKKKWKEKYERVQLDVEVLFHRTEGGLLRCEKNKQALEQIRKNVQIRNKQLLAKLNKSPHFHLKEADLNECQIIFVFCIINTRIESDVKAAMEKIPESAGDKPVILVVMHHTRDIDFTTTRKEWKDKYERVQLDVEVLFHRSEGGLLRCEKNKQAVKQMRKKIKK
ncbi:unnamed protein product [Menidia menidia]|uniref:(Atlantic silverside) hypothetical protein n=1 Tax=Menidia menidia TaxID=238744 RepID=A0A8S4BAH2_9TELE|nr:unnamed protein product [Menidia menidia]